MPAKIYHIDSIGSVSISKRNGSKSIRLSFDDKGTIKVSIPTWVPYQAGVAFVRQRVEWIIKHRPATQSLFTTGDKIGKAHHMSLVGDPKVKSVQVRLKDSVIVVKFPSTVPASDSSVQTAAERGAKKALWEEAERLLPIRLQSLADLHSFSYKSIEVKQLKTKWGSCNQNHEITLNYYLMQLPWHLIDYVLIHELVHTEYLNHSTGFWERFEQSLPGAKKIRRELKTYKTTVISQ
jgi:predicted metal-dependent hydrolase